MDMQNTIELAKKLGFIYSDDGDIEYFEFPNETISLPFASFIRTLSALSILTSSNKESLFKTQNTVDKIHFSVGDKISNPQSKFVGPPLTADDAELFNWAFNNLLTSVEKAQEMYFSMYVITLVSKFEAYIQDMVTEISSRYPETMKSNRMISFSEVLQFNEMSSLVEYLAINTSSKSTEGTTTEYICRIGNRYGITICQFKDLLKEVERFVDVRHIQVHKNGIIDTLFFSKYPDAGKIGERYILNFSILAEMSCLFRITVNLIEVMLISKFPKIAIINNLDDLYLEFDRICEKENTEFAE
jgi:hypothetical protein